MAAIQETVDVNDVDFFLESLLWKVDGPPHPQAEEFLAKGALEDAEVFSKLCATLIRTYNKHIFEEQINPDLNIVSVKKVIGAYAMHGKKDWFFISHQRCSCSTARVVIALTHEIAHFGQRRISKEPYYGIGEEDHGDIWSSWADKIRAVFPSLPPIPKTVPWKAGEVDPKKYRDPERQREEQERERRNKEEERQQREEKRLREMRKKAEEEERVRREQMEKEARKGKEEEEKRRKEEDEEERRRNEEEEDRRRRKKDSILICDEDEEEDDAASFRYDTRCMGRKIGSSSRSNAAAAARGGS